MTNSKVWKMKTEKTKNNRHKDRRVIISLMVVTALLALIGVEILGQLGKIICLERDKITEIYGRRRKAALIL